MMAKQTSRVGLMLLALIAALAARIGLDGTLPAAWMSRWPFLGSLWLGCGLLLLALVLFGLSAPAAVLVSDRSPAAASPPRRHTASPDAHIVRWRRDEDAGHGDASAAKDRRLTVGLLASTLVCYLSSLVLWAAVGETSASRACWVAAVVCYSLSFVNASKWHSRWSAIRDSFRQRSTVVEAVLLMVLIGAAFGLRFYRVESLPLDMHGDMASHAFQARELLYGAQRQLWTVGYGGVPMLGYVPMALSLALFGDDLFAFRMSAVIGGTISILGLYLLARELFGRRVAWLGAAMLTISYAHIHFSRVGQFMDAVPWVTFALLFFVRGIRRGRRADYAISGILMGMGLQMYYASRVMLVLLPLLVIWRGLADRRSVRATLGGMTATVLGVVVAFGPMLLYFVVQPGAFVGRTQQVSLFNPAVMSHLQSKYGLHSAAQVVLEQTKRSLLTFYRYGDASTQFSLQRPFTSTLVSVLLPGGLGYALARPRRMGHGLLLIWLGVTLVFGSILTNDAPTWPHIVSILLPVMTLAGLALDRVWSAVETLPGRAGSMVFLCMVALALGLTGVASWRMYTEHAADSARPRTRIGRYLASCPAATRYYVVQDPFYATDREIRFLAGERIGADLEEADLLEGTVPAEPCPCVFIVTPNHLAVLESVQRAYANGETIEHREPNGTLAFVSYEVVGP